MPNSLKPKEVVVGRENERRFIVREGRDGLDSSVFVGGKRLAQAFLRRDEHHILRIRIIGEGEDRSALVTYKEGKGQHRRENEYPPPEGLSVPDVPIELAEFLMEHALDPMDKTRYRRDGWEIDCLHGVFEGFVMVELEDPPDDLQKPEWVTGEWIEVTGVVTNAALAVCSNIFKDAEPDKITQAVLWHFAFD